MVLLSPPLVCAQFQVCPPLCTGAGEHPWVLCTPHQAGPSPVLPQPPGREPPGHGGMGAAQDEDTDCGNGVSLRCHPGVGAVPAPTSWGSMCPPLGGSRRALFHRWDKSHGWCCPGEPLQTCLRGMVQSWWQRRAVGRAGPRGSPCDLAHMHHSPQHSPGCQGPALGSHNQDPTSSLQPLPSSLITHHLINTAIISVKAPPFP